MSDPTSKPSSNEEEYFRKLDQEKLAKHRAEAQAAKAEADRAARKELHWMHCPKCGAGLVTENFRSIQVDRCPECEGVWFDAGEVEGLMGKEGAGSGFFGDLFGSISSRKKKSS